MQGLGIPNHIVQAVLNHALPGVGGVYLQNELEAQKAEALATWANALDADRRARCGCRHEAHRPRNLRDVVDMLLGGARPLTSLPDGQVTIRD